MQKKIYLVIYLILTLLYNNREKVVIQIKEKDIEFLQAELDITYEQAKAYLIKFQGNIDKVIENFLKDFKFAI